MRYLIRLRHDCFASQRFAIVCIPRPGCRIRGRHYPETKSRPRTTLYGVEAGLARFLAVDIEGMTTLGSGYLAGSVDFAKAKAEVFGGMVTDMPEIEFNNWRYTGDPTFQLGARLSVQVLLELIGAHYEVGYDSPAIPVFECELPIELTVRLDAAVHAFARLYVEVGFGLHNSAQIGGKAFAGVSTTLAAQAELASLAGVEGSVTAWAGVGVEFTLGAEADLQKGKFDFTSSAGTAAGVGASYDYGVSVSPGEIYKATEFSDQAPDIWDQFWQRVESAGESMAAGDRSLFDFGSEFISASGQALGQVAGAIDDSLP